MDSTCTGMAFFPVNFMLQTPPGDNNDKNLHPPVSSFLPSCTPQDFHVGSGGIAPFLGKRSMTFSEIDLCENASMQLNHNTHNNVGDDYLSDEGSQLVSVGEKKRRLNIEQVKTLEKNFELGNKLDPERKLQLAKALGLQPRQIAIWFQNRRARWKTKQLEKDYQLLKRQFDALKADNDALQCQNQQLQAEILALKNRESTESINLNKETEGSCSNRSENNSEIKLDIPKTLTTIESPLNISTHPTTITAETTTTTITGRNLFPTSSLRPNEPLATQLLFQSPQAPSVKEGNLTSMFCSMDDQSGLWPWLEQQNYD